MQAACELPEGAHVEGLLVLALCAMIALGLGRAVGACGADDDSDDDEDDDDDVAETGTAEP